MNSDKEKVKSKKEITKMKMPKRGKNMSFYSYCIATLKNLSATRTQIMVGK